MNSIIEQHMTRYPQMEARDLYKLIYQSEFGCEHLVSDPNTALAYINDEWASANGDIPLFEDIGGGYVRLHLSAAKKAGMHPECVCRLFVASANIASNGTREGFVAKTSLLRGLFPDNVLDLMDAHMSETDYAPLRHSQTYRDAYNPAYRVIRKDFAEIWKIVNAIEKTKLIKPRVSVALDGRCASGKTTRAALLAAIYACDIIHMDDFFLPPDMRTDQRLSQPGGNVHYERFYNEVSPHLNDDMAFSYNAFDCSVLTYTPKPIRANTVRIVEGSYALHPQLRDLYDIKVFCDISPECQMKRIVKREGTAYAQVFKDKWIPLEERYIAGFNVPETCDVLLRDGKTLL